MLDTSLRYINIDFDNNGHQGLFNKIIYLSGIVRYSKKNNIRLVEPIYKIGINHHSIGTPVLFSKIFNIDYFNNKMKKHNFELIKRSEINQYNNINKVKIVIENLDHSYANVYGWNIELNDYIYKAVNLKSISIDDNILLDILNSLELSIYCMNLLKSFCINNKLFELDKLSLEYINKDIYSLNNIIKNKFNSIHIRNEFDWPDTWGKIDNTTLVKMCDNNNFKNKKMFFSTGENHNKINKLFNNINCKNCYFADNNLSYDIKTAISYKLCLLSDLFISHPLSTFSSLIVMQRELTNNNNNYYYTLNDILKRNDKGLGCFGRSHTDDEKLEAGINVSISKYLKN